MHTQSQIDATLMVKVVEKKRVFKEKKRVFKDKYRHLFRR
jgi:hypothetical protein